MVKKKIRLLCYFMLLMLMTTLFGCSMPDLTLKNQSNDNGKTSEVNISETDDNVDYTQETYTDVNKNTETPTSPQTIENEENVIDSSSEKNENGIAIAEIASVNWNEDENMSNMTMYDSKKESFYYFDNTVDGYLYIYDEVKKNSLPLISVAELTGESDDIVQSKKGAIYSLVYNKYTNTPYVFGKDGLADGFWLYDINESTTISVCSKLYNIYDALLYFIDETHFVIYGENTAFGVLDNDNHISSLMNGYSYNGYSLGDSNIKYAFNYKNNEYIFVDAIGNNMLLSAGNYYNISINEILTIQCDKDIKYTSYCLLNDELYYKDYYNNIFKLDIENGKSSIYIDISDVIQDSADFLSDKCCGLQVLNNHNIVTYDSSVKKLKCFLLNDKEY